MTRDSAAVPLTRLNFPPYVAAVLSDHHILIAGGGGASKTGVANRMEIFEINKAGCRADRIASVETASTALMNGTIFEFEDETYIAAGGIGGICQIFTAKLSVDCETSMNGIQRNGSPVFSDPDHNNMYLRRRNSSSSSRDSVSHVSNGHVNGLRASNAATDHERRLTYNIQPFKSFKCDYVDNAKPDVDESFLKAVKFCSKSNVLVTGGSDGHVRLWQFPSLHNTIDIRVTEKEIVDLDVDIIGESLVTIARDGRCSLWRMKNGSKISDLEYVIPVAKNAMRTTKYKFKGCRFLPHAEAPQILFTTLVPASWSKPPEPCYLCRWDVQLSINDRRVIVGTDPIAHMSISSDGACLALGTLTGAVCVYGTSSMKKLYQVDNCHRSFVTRVEFLRTCPDDESVPKSCEHLVSISVDNQVYLHTISLNDSFGILGSPVIFVATLIFVYLVSLLIGL